MGLIQGLFEYLADFGTAKIEKVEEEHSVPFRVQGRMQTWRLHRLKSSWSMHGLGYKDRGT